VQVTSSTITEPNFSQLKMAVEQENIEAIRSFVRRHNNVNQRELPSQQSALAIAAAGRHDNSVKTLLELGADVNCADYIGITPLMNAVAANDATAVRLLIASGANTAARNKAGQSALSLAHELHRDELAELLLTTRKAPSVR
jgi:ankyrin repeat protein